MNGQGQTKLIYPGLAGFYATMMPIAATLVRVVVGIMFLMHVSVKFKIGAAAVAANIMAKNGLEPALGFAYVAMALELIGGVCLIIGLFTRFFAAALAIEMLIALIFYASPEGLRGRSRRIRIRSANRRRVFRHRHARWRALLGRRQDRQGTVEPA